MTKSAGRAKSPLTEPAYPLVKVEVIEWSDNRQEFINRVRAILETARDHGRVTIAHGAAVELLGLLDV